MELFIFLYIVTLVPFTNGIDVRKLLDNNTKTLVCNSEELRYQDLYLYKLQENMFIHCDEIISLNLTQNNIRSIENQTFKKLKGLKQIDLSSNYIISLPTDIFSYTEKIEYIFITKNRITSLQRNLFANLPYLKSVNFAANNITFVAEKCFVKVPSLISINLANNNLKTLQFNIIDDISTVSVFYLIGNDWNCDIKLCEFMHTVVARFWLEPFVPYCHSPSDIRESTFKEVIETPLPTVQSNVMNDPTAEPVILKCHTCSKTSLSWQLGSSIRLTDKAHEISGKYSTESTFKIYDFSHSDEGNYTCYAGTCATCESSTWIYMNIDIRSLLYSNKSSGSTIGYKVIFPGLGFVLFLIGICCRICKTAMLQKQNEPQSAPTDRLEMRSNWSDED